MKIDGDGLIGNWNPGIGDPTLMGWLTVLLYGFAALLSYRVIKYEYDLPIFLEKNERRLWLLFVVGLVLLGINKQLDLQSAFTEAGRMLAHAQGWYEERQRFQMAFISVIGMLGILLMLIVGLLAIGAPKATWIALVGGAFLVVFVLIRAASFHHVDAVIGQTFIGLRLNWLFEMGGLLVIAAGAWQRTRGMQCG